MLAHEREDVRVVANKTEPFIKNHVSFFLRNSISTRPNLSLSVRQVTTLVNTSNKGPSSKKKGRSKKAHVLALSVEQATQNFLEKGEQIAKNSHDLKEELILAVEDVRKQGMSALGHHTMLNSCV